MLHRGNSSDETETTPRNAVLVTVRNSRHYPPETKVYEDPQKIPGRFACEQPRYEMEPRFEKRRKNRTKSQIQHCPSCHFPCVNYSSGKTKYSDNVEAVMNRYEHFREEPIRQPIKKSQSSPLSPRPCTCDQSYHRTKQRYHESRRRDRRNDREPYSSVCCNLTNASAVNDSMEGYCGHLHPTSLKGTRTEGHWRDDPTEVYFECSDSESPEKHTRVYHGSKKPTRTEVGLKKSGDRSRSKSKSKYVEMKEEAADCWQQLDPNELGTTKLLLELLERENTRKTDPRLELASEIRNKTSSTMDASDFSKDEDVWKLLESYNRCPPAGVIKGPTVCKSNEDPSPSRENPRQDCEVIVRERNHQEAIGKNVYGAGDVDLCATKSHILGLIDRALSNEFGSVSDQQKISDRKHNSTQEEICIEITRALHENCCVQDLSSHVTTVDRLKQLRMLRWEHLNHIQEEIRKLCSLEKFLDNYSSPRQSLPMLQQQQQQQQQQTGDQSEEQKQELTTAT